MEICRKTTMEKRKWRRRQLRCIKCTMRTKVWKVHVVLSAVGSPGVVIRAVVWEQRVQHRFSLRTCWSRLARRPAYPHCGGPLHQIAVLPLRWETVHPKLASQGLSAQMDRALPLCRHLEVHGLHAAAQVVQGARQGARQSVP